MDKPLIVKSGEPATPGLREIVSRKGTNADLLMDFSVLRLAPGGSWSSGSQDEKAFLLVSGDVELAWQKEGKDVGGNVTRARATRHSLIDEPPTVLHVPGAFGVVITAGVEGAEIAVIRTENHRPFAPRFYPPSDCRSEERGAGTMNETCTRTVRTVFDDSNAPDAALVLGEVVTPPGRWSSYPPHWHRQPEIYHYRFFPVQGFGLAAIGEDAVVIRNNDTVLIRDGNVHPHAAAPGYTLWYIWVIRHLEGDRYGVPTFAPEHAWTGGMK